MGPPIQPDMNTKDTHAVVASKIVSASLLAGVGAVGLYGSYDLDSARTRVAVLMLGLGIWLLVGAWTGRTVGVRWRSFCQKFATALGAEQPSTGTEPASAPGVDAVPGSRG